MQNDVDLVRAILAAVRERKDLWPKEVDLPEYDPLLVARHVERLHDDGLIEGVRLQLVSKSVASIQVRDLTSAGHEFLSALESGDVWGRLKSALSPKELGALSLRELGAIAKELAVLGIKKKLGLE